MPKCAGLQLKTGDGRADDSRTYGCGSLGDTCAEIAHAIYELGLDNLGAEIPSALSFAGLPELSFDER